MELEILKKCLDYIPKKKKKWVLVLGALGLTSYGAYRIYTLPSVVKKRQRLLKLLGAFVSLAEMVSDSCEAIGILSRDIKEFIQSDSDEIPQSIKQLSKITTSDEISESLTRITRALTIGILRGYRQEISRKSSDSSFSDRFVDKLFSDAGSGFASVVVGSFARNMVMAFYSDYDRGSCLSDYDRVKSDVPRWIEVACEDKGREVLGDCIRTFVSTAVAVYLDKTKDINTYDEIFSGLTNPRHEARVRDLVVSACNGAVETFIRTSHESWTRNPTRNSSISKLDFEDGFSLDERGSIGTKLISATLRTKKLVDRSRESGWISKISSTLAVPSNRKFVLDMTGTVTFETIRSFLEFVLQRLAECVKRSVDIVHHEVIDRGGEAIRYVSNRSSTVTTVCLTLCLHILNGPWILTPYEFS